MAAFDAVRLDGEGLIDMDRFPDDGTALADAEAAGVRDALLSDPVGEPSDEAWDVLVADVVAAVDVDAGTDGSFETGGLFAVDPIDPVDDVDDVEPIDLDGLEGADPDAIEDGLLAAAGDDDADPLDDFLLRDDGGAGDDAPAADDVDGTLAGPHVEGDL